MCLSTPCETNDRFRRSIMDQQLKAVISNERTKVGGEQARNISSQLAHLLHEGIAAAKADDKALARTLLLQATDLDAQNETAWLWLASISDQVQERLHFLERVLAINPNSERAQTWISTTRRQLVMGLIQRGIAAAKKNDKATALYLLLQAVDEDPVNETAWLWMASVAEEIEEKLTYLQRVLEINPENEHARNSIAVLQPRTTKMSTSWFCPLCQTEAETQTAQCNVCGAILILDDVDRLLANAAVNKDLVKAGIDHLKKQMKDTSAPSNYYLLGLAHLNLKDFKMGLNFLQSAVRLNPQDEVLRSQVECLRQRINEMEAAQAVAVAQQAAAKNKSSGKVIMVVDDSPTVRKLVTIKLEKHGHRVVSAVDGMDALSKLSEEIPNLILLDVTMPRLDGYQLCKIIKANAAYKHIPVVMLSGKDGFFDKVRGRMAGSAAYITKPFEPETLLSTVDEYCV